MCFYLSLFFLSYFFFNDTATTEIYTYRHTLSLHDALPIWILLWSVQLAFRRGGSGCGVIGTRLFPLSAGAARMSACEHGSTGLQFLGGIFAQASSSFGHRRTGGSRLR